MKKFIIFYLLIHLGTAQAIIPESYKKLPSDITNMLQSTTIPFNEMVCNLSKGAGGLYLCITAMQLHTFCTEQLKSKNTILPDNVLKCGRAMSDVGILTGAFIAIRASIALICSKPN